MKRKTVINRMTNCFNTCSKMEYSIPECMDRVLEICEEAGMLPPNNKNTYSNGALDLNWENEDEA
jgi:hypothetical protein